VWLILPEAAHSMGRWAGENPRSEEAVAFCPDGAVALALLQEAVLTYRYTITEHWQQTAMHFFFMMHSLLQRPPLTMFDPP
jgi:hypothetical protein